MNNSDYTESYVGGVGEGDLEAWQDAQAEKVKAKLNEAINAQKRSEPTITIDVGGSGCRINPVDEQAAAAITLGQVLDKAPSKHEARKQAPIFEGVLQYFPDAIWEVARCSKIGNDQHNDPSLPMHWDRDKSTDEASALCRHLMQYDQLDDDNLLHAVKVAWRGLALLQKTLEARGEAPLSQYNQPQNHGTLSDHIQ